MEVLSLLIALVVLVAFTFFVAVQLFRALQAIVLQMQSVASLANQIHQRDQKALQTVLDRLMAVDFASFKDYHMAEQSINRQLEGEVDQETPAQRRRERPWVAPPPSESAFRRDHEARYGPSEDVTSHDETQILQQLEEEGLPK